MSLGALLALGFLLGMRHATDADHIAAVSAIVSRERTLRAAAPVGMLWGLGHFVTVLLVGGAIILFGIVIPPRVGLGLEFSVALMLVLLGALNVRSSWAGARGPVPQRAGSALRPLAVGVVHGLAGSAAVALLVLGVVRDELAALAYLLIFGAGTIAGMLLVTTAFALPVALAARRFSRLHGALCLLTGMGSVVFGAALSYQIGFVDGLFRDQLSWAPEHF